MEADEFRIDNVVLVLSNHGNKFLAHRVIDFLDSEDLEILGIELQKCKVKSSFSELILTCRFLSNFLNKVDRTFYYSLFDDPHFLAIEASQRVIIGNFNSDCFLEYPQIYDKCFSFMEALFPTFIEGNEIVEELRRMVTDPDIPMPKLKRENQGIFCKTVFQNHLVSLKFSSDMMQDYDQLYEDLNTYFQSQEENYLEKLFLRATKDKNLDKKVRFLRFTPYEITINNYEQYLIQGNSLHNFLVSIFLLTDIWLSSLKVYISSLSDPYHRFIEILTRYSIFRNFVISLEECISFAFQQYDSLYSEVFGSGKPQYRFWRAAMTKWILKFKEFNPECNAVYYSCLSKMRVNFALNYLSEQELKDPEQYIVRKIKNEMDLHTHEIEISESLFPEEHASNGVSNLIESDPEQLQIIIIEYLEHLIDLSINEETVHWCGHSEHILSEPYLSFEKFFIDQNKLWLNYVKVLTEKEEVRKDLLQSDLEFLQTLDFKPASLKKIIKEINCNFEIVSIEHAPEEAREVFLDFKASDETLKYFNEKTSIKNLFTEEEMIFYSIAPLISTEEILTKSLATATTDDSALLDDDQSDCELEYFSEGEEDGKEGEVKGTEDEDRGLLRVLLKSSSSHTKVEENECLDAETDTLNSNLKNKNSSSIQHEGPPPPPPKLYYQNKSSHYEEESTEISLNIENNALEFNELTDLEGKESKNDVGKGGSNLFQNDNK